MHSAEWCLFTSVFVALILVHHSAASAFHSTPEEDEPARVPSLSRKITDVILVSFKKPWNEAHTSFARILGGPITTWRIPNSILDSYIARSIEQFTKPILVAADPGESFETIQMIRYELRSIYCFSWLFVRHNLQIRTHTTNSWPPLTRCGVVGVLGMNSTVIQSIFWPHDLSTDHNPGSSEMLAKLQIPHRSSVNRLIGQQLTVPCHKISFYWATQNLCDEGVPKHILALLIAINVTVKQLDIPVDDKFEWIFSKRWDIALYDWNVRINSLLFFDIPLFFLDYDTFYSRVDCHRVITLLEAAGESWKLVATTLVLLALVLLVSVAVGEKGWSALRRFSDTAMFLLAAVLGTSAVQPNAVRLMAVRRKALLGLWLVAILPLSVYFRSELTSMLTLKRPAHRIDTLQKLEDALDRNEVLPCVVAKSTQHDDLEEKVDYVTQRSLMNKLQFAFAIHGDEVLAKEDTLACLHCAMRLDRICLGYSNGPRPFPNKCPNVRAVVEHFKMEPRGFHMRKFHELYEPLKRLFLAAQERGLLPQDREEHDYGAADNQFDGSGLFMLLLILHASSCLVLGLEILVAWCLRRT